MKQYENNIFFSESDDVKFDIVILLGVIEHVGNIHLLSNEFYNITKDNAIIYVNTPYMFKIHGPVPDYWRISQYGYEHLFGNSILKLTHFHQMNREKIVFHYRIMF